jgi:hypothetical protein
VAWQGDFGDRNGKKSIILEAIASEDLHIWHAFFGLPGSNNDLNVLDHSPLVENLLTYEVRDRRFTINGCEYDRYYLLLDGIYPKWSIFVQSIHLAPDEKWAYFAERQEAVRKDVERYFGCCNPTLPLCTILVAIGLCPSSTTSCTLVASSTI